MTRLVVFSDVQGNTPALAALLSACEELRPDVMVNLGDIASGGGVDPRGTLDLLASRPDFVTVRGNHERQLLTRTEHVPGGSDWLAARSLTDRDRRWLASLAERARPAPGVLAVHGSPDDDLTYLLETVDRAHPGALREATDDEVLDRLGPWASMTDVVLCGHTHLQRVRHLPNCTLVIHPGSLGWPAYEDDAPAPPASRPARPTRGSWCSTATTRRRRGGGRRLAPSPMTMSRPPGRRSATAAPMSLMPSGPAAPVLDRAADAGTAPAPRRGPSPGPRPFTVRHPRGAPGVGARTLDGVGTPAHPSHGRTSHG